MRKTKSDNKISITRVPRLTLPIEPQIQPAVNHYEVISTANTTAILDSIPSVSPRHIRTDDTIRPSVDDINGKAKTTELFSRNTEKSSTLSNGNVDNLKEIKDSNDGCCNWYNNLTSKQKIVFKVIIVILVILAAAGGTIPPVYLFLIRQIHLESSLTNVTVSACSASTCIGKETPYRSTMATALYLFDGNANDLSGYATGTGFGTAAPGYTPMAYITQALNLNSALFQYVQIPNINFAKQSFTLQTWVYTPAAIAIPSDFGIFGQCDTSGICLSLSLRNARFTLSFDSNNTANTPLTGASVIGVTTWVHITIVYDATLSQQQIYVNGKVDAVSHGIITSYQGVSSSSITTIGRSTSFTFGTTYFNGRIDHFTISAGIARNSCQVLDDASLLVYYPFDTTGTLNDYNVNLCNGVASGITAVSAGRVNQAISFPLSTSYFQSQCFPRMRANEPSFSFSLWVNPSSTTGGGTLVHISASSIGGGNCYDLLVFTSTGSLVLQWMLSAISASSAQGPIIPANTWTHVAVVYGAVNGIRLYINGQFSTSSANTAAFLVLDSNNPWYMTLANVGSLGPIGIVCQNGAIPIVSGSFTGSIDEFRVYNREIDNQELCVLSNP